MAYLIGEVVEYPLGVTRMRTRRRGGWRRAWGLYGPLIPIALAAGLLTGCALAFLHLRGLRW
jgi:hypothetical protein